MVYKLFNEEGSYIDKSTGEPRNLCSAEIAISADGVNVGWIEFGTIEEAENYFGIRKRELA